MTTESSQEYIRKQLEFAESALSDAEYLIEGSRYRAAANRAYYAMFHAALAAIESVGVERPRTHAGTIYLFGRHLVVAGRLDKATADDFQIAYDLRQMSDYNAYSSIREEQISASVSGARVFLEGVRKLVEKK